MATEAQINANKENSQKSTGPKTAEGKAAVSQNALKHGLFASGMVVNGEDQAEFDLYSEAMLGEMKPVGPIESMLAGRIVSLSWRLKRTDRMQNQAINEMLKWLITPPPIELYARSLTPIFLRTNEENIHPPEPKMALGRVARRDWAKDKVLDRLMIYERRIESSLLRIMRELKKLQLMRRIEREDAVDKKSAAQSSPPRGRRASLKKQSQYVAGMMDLSSYLPTDYDDNPCCEAGEDKAKQSQFLSPAGPIGVGQSPDG